MPFHPRRQHIAQGSPVGGGGSARTLVLVAIGASTFFLNARPSAFFAATIAKEPATKAPLNSAALAAQEQRAAFYKEPRFLKLLLPQEDIFKLGGHLGINQLADKTNTKVKFARKGEYYPFSTFPVRPLILAGDTQALLSAFREMSAKCEKDEDEYVTFLVPSSCKGRLVGTGGSNINAITEKTSANIQFEDDSRVRWISGEDRIRVYGKAAAVEAVVEWLLAEQDEYIDDMRNMLHTEYQTAHPQNLPAEILVLLDDRQTRQLMGKGGSTIQKTSKMYSVHMQLDTSNKGPNGESILKISGAVGDVHAAHTGVLKNFIMPKPSPKE